MSKHWQGTQACLSAFFLLAIGSPEWIFAFAEIQPPPIFSSVSDSASSKSPAQGTLESMLDKLPVFFEANRGQLPPGIRYQSVHSTARVSFGDRQVVLSLPPGNSLRIDLIGSDEKVRPKAENKIAGKKNYFLGNDPLKWLTDIPLYERIRYARIYPGIDLLYYGRQRRLEYDFVVTPGADPRQIQIAFQGTMGMRLDDRGDLILEWLGGEVRFQRPSIYQIASSGRREIPGGFRIRKGNRVVFDIGPYDVNQPLIIDPILSYSSYLGTTGTDAGHAVAVDRTGNIYLTGAIGSSTFATTNPAIGSANPFCLFVAKFNPAGSALIYSTLIGGSSTDVGNAIAVDAGGYAYVAGQTKSSNFPTVNPIQGSFGGGESDAFVLRLNPAGNALSYSTYLGGSGSEGEINVIATVPRMGIALHESGFTFVTGETDSGNFPCVGGYQTIHRGGTDAFVAKINPAGNALVYSTLLGGSSSEAGRAIAVDSTMHALITGATTSYDFPLQNPLRPTLQGSEAFVSCLNSAGNSLSYSTFLGGSGDEEGYGIFTDNSDSAYIVGKTTSSDFPVSGAFQTSLRGSTDAFLTKISPAGTAIVYSTYYGGSGNETGTGIRVDPSGNAYLTGITHSEDLPLSNPFQANLGGSKGMKSENSGVDWTSSTAGLDNLSVLALLYDRQNPSILYAGTDKGIYKSISGGKQWFLCDSRLPGYTSNLRNRLFDQPILLDRFSLLRPTSELGMPTGELIQLIVQSRLPTGLKFVLTLYLVLYSILGGDFWGQYPILAAHSEVSDLSHLMLQEGNHPTSGTEIPMNLDLVISDNFRSPNQAELSSATAETIFLLNTVGVFTRSAEDTVSPWTPIHNGLPSDICCLEGGPDGAIYAAKLSPVGIYRLLPNGTTWSKISQTWNGQSTYRLAWESANRSSLLQPESITGVWANGGKQFQRHPGNPNRMVIGGEGNDGGVFTSTNGGVTWTSSTTFPDRYVAFVELDPHNENVIYAGTYTKLYRSPDFGSQWIDLSRNIKIDSLTALAVHPTDSAQLYLGGYLSPDAFVAQINPAGNVLLSSSYLGGMSSEGGVSLSLFDTNKAYITGITESDDFPTISPYQATNKGYQEAFIAKVTPHSPLLSGTPQGAIDGPAKNSTLQGVVRVSGWAIVVSGNTASIPTRLEWLVDGIPRLVLTSGRSRPDVSQYLAGLGISAPSTIGYSGDWDTRTAADGSHSISLRAMDASGIAKAIASATYVLSNGIPETTASTSSSITSSTSSSTSTSSSSSTSTSMTSPISSSSTSTSTSSTTTSTLATRHFRYFPKVVSQTNAYTGIAVVNLSTGNANLRFRAYGNTGTELATTVRSLAAKNQLALMLNELLPEFQGTGWMSMESDVSAVEGFFLLFDGGPTYMDGAAVFGTLQKDLLIHAADNAEISLVNPGSAPVVCSLSYLDDSGASVSQSQQTIPPLQRMTLSPSVPSRKTRSEEMQTTGRHLRLQSDGIVSLSVFGKSSWTGVLPGQETRETFSGRWVMYAPQYVSGGGYTTRLDLINLEDIANTVNLRVIGADGVPLGHTATVTLPAQGATRILNPTLFGLPDQPTAAQGGYVELESASGRFGGSVCFTDPSEMQFGSALPLVRSLQNLAYFSQVAQNDQYFTGLAALNPGTGAARVTVTVYDTASKVVGAGETILPAGGRFSKILTELVGPLPAMMRGYFAVQSDVPLASFALFGTSSGAVLSAIPAQSATQ